MRKLAATSTTESVMAAKMLAVVMPRSTAMTDWRMLEFSDERGLMKISQTA